MRSWLKSIKNRRWAILNALVLAIMLAVLGVQVTDKPTSRGISIGSWFGGEKVITLGPASAFAAGAVDYTFDGVADNVQFQAALNALPATGGRLVIVSATTIVFAATVTRAIDNVTIEGSGRGTYFTYDAVNPIFTAGGNNWKFVNVRTDAGSLSMGATTGWEWNNVTIAATYYAYRTPRASTTAANWEIPTGRSTLVVCSSGVLYTAQCDYVADGVSDAVEIQAAINAAPDNSAVVLWGSFAVGGTTISISSRNYLDILGIRASIISTSATTTILIDDSTFVSLQGISISPNAGADTPVLISGNSNHILLDAVRIVTTADKGIVLVTAAGETIADVTIQNSEVLQATNGSISTGINGTISRLKILNSRFNSTVQAAEQFELDGPIDDLLIQGNTISGNGVAIEINNHAAGGEVVADTVGASNVRILNNVITSTGGDFAVTVFALGTNTPPRDILISGNQITALNRGVQLRGRADDNGGQPHPYRITVSENQITSTTLDIGVSVYEFNDQVVIRGNTITADAAIYVAADATLITGNYLHDTPRGIQLTATADNNQLSGNVFDSVTLKVSDSGTGNGVRLDNTRAIDGWEFLPSLLTSGRLLHVPVNAGWTAFTVNTGSGAQQTMRQYVNTGVGASSSSLFLTQVAAMATSFAYNQGIDFDKDFRLYFTINRDTSEAQSVTRLQLKQASTEGILAAKGVGIQIDNLAMTGESYGAARETVDLTLAMTSVQWYAVEIRHNAGTSVQFYVNGTLEGTITGANIPSLQITSIYYFVHSIINGLAGGTDAYSFISPIWIWLES